MAACCAVGALIIYKLMTIYSKLPSIKSRRVESDTKHQINGLLAQQDESIDDATSQTCRFSLHGLTCMSCVSAVENALLEVPGIETVSVSLHALTAFATFNPKQVQPETIRTQIESTGFEAEIVADGSDWASQWTKAAESRERSIEEWKRAFQYSIIGSVLVFVLETLQRWLPIPATGIARLIVVVAKTAVTFALILWLGRPIHREAFAALKHTQLNTSILSSVGLIFAMLSAIMQELGPQASPAGSARMTSACMLLTLTIGVKLIKCAVSRRSSQLPTLLASALPESVELVLGSSTERETTSIPTHVLQKGDFIQVSNGAAFSGDCIIVEGSSSILQTIVNGELDPITVRSGETVHAGATNCGEPIVAKVIRTGQETWLGQTLRALSKANEVKSDLQSFSDRFLEWFSTAVIALAIAVAVDRALAGASMHTILDGVASILLCACPCTLGMGIPVCLMAATQNAYSQKIVLGAGSQVERAARARIVVFDKTGTLTTGELRMVDLELEKSWVQGDRHSMLWSTIQAVANKSHHPVSRLLLRHGSSLSRKEDQVVKASVESFEEHPGMGMTASVSVRGRELQLLIGNLRLMQTHGIYLDRSCSDPSLHPQSTTGVVYVSVDGKLAMQATYSDSLMPSAIEIVNQLRKRGYQTYLMTGDVKSSAENVARQVGIPLEHVHASLLPHDKASLIETLERRYGPVIMVGDNLNDAPALAAATFGIVISRQMVEHGSDEIEKSSDALQTFYAEADALLMPQGDSALQNVSQVAQSLPALEEHSLSRVLYVVDLLRETCARMYRILKWSLAYNVVALSVASGLLRLFLPHKFAAWASIDPTSASLLMSLNSIATLMYCLRLADWQPAPESAEKGSRGGEDVNRQCSSEKAWKDSMQNEL